MKRPVQLLLVFALVSIDVGMVNLEAAQAQEPSRAELAAARRLFRQGMRAGEQGNWEEAREAFAQAYEIAPRPRALLNLGSAQMQTGQLLEATETYQRFMAQVTSGPDMEYRDGVEEELESLEERTPRVRIEAASLETGDRVHVDGSAVSNAILRVELPLNPGAHTFAIVRAGEELTREEVTLEEGEQRTVALDAAAATLPPVTLPEDEADDVLAPDDDDSGGVLSSPWLWVGIGAAVVVGVVIAIVVVATSGGADRQSGNFGDGRLVIE